MPIIDELTVRVNVEIVEDAKELIRQIVREEIEKKEAAEKAATVVNGSIDGGLIVKETLAVVGESIHT